MADKIIIGISACLLGQKVRYDGDHRLNQPLIDTLGEYVDFYPLCPEVEFGFSTPREPFRLEGEPESPRLVTINSHEDHTREFIRWSRKRVSDLEKEHLRGFIFKGKSPSCGMECVKVYGENGMPRKEGIGLFARIFLDHFPLLPVDEGDRLDDPRIRKDFIGKLLED